MSLAISGTVNGIAAAGTVETTGTDLVTIPYFTIGGAFTLDVETDGSGSHAPNHRVAFIAGDTPGRDHFPFRNSGPTLPTSLGNALQVKLFWVVRKWRIVVDQIPTGETDPGPFVLESYDLDADVFAVTESDLVTHGSPFWTDPAAPGGGGRFLTIEFATDGTAKFSALIYGATGEVDGNHPWADSMLFDGADYSFTATPYEYWPYANTSSAAVYDTTTGAQLVDPLS